jgi:hypothetical protein
LLWRFEYLGIHPGLSRTICPASTLDRGLAARARWRFRCD